MTNAPHDNYSQYSDPLGLTIDESTELSNEDIARMLETAGDIGSAVQWLQGDLVNYARKTKNDSWLDYLSHKLDIRTLNNRASIANKIPRERRRINLSFSHHAAVTRLDEAEQEYWLNKADKEGMTRDELRQAVKDVAKVEKRTVIGHVGSIDKLLSLDLGLPLNFEVKIVYEVILEKELARAS